MIGRSSFFTALAMLLATILAVMLIAARPVPAVVRSGLENLPVELAGYRGTDDHYPESVMAELKTDVSLYRHYLAASGPPLDLYIGYYGTAKGGRTGHNPYACLPGAGWAIVETRTVNIPHSGGGGDSVNYVLARREGVNTVLLHWYQTGGSTVLSTGLRQNLERLKGRILNNRNDGAFVQVSARVTDNGVAEAGEKARRFAGAVIERLPGVWPVEEERPSPTPLGRIFFRGAGR